METLHENRSELAPTELNNVVANFFRSYRDKQLALAGNIDANQKRDGSDVTDLDVEIENALKHHLTSIYPGLIVMGEETGYTAGLTTEFGLIDPIDGTTSFIKGIPTWTNMFAYVSDGRVASAVIYNPKQDNMFTAVRGKGAHKNNERLDLSQAPPAKIILCKQNLIEPIKAILGDEFVYQVPPSGGGHGLTMVAEGKVAARFQLLASGVAHDYAPGGLLVNEAGGCNIPIKAAEYTFTCNSFVACHPSLKDIMQQNVDRFKDLER